MSQNGADSQSPYPFLKSKGVAQDAVSQSSLELDHPQAVRDLRPGGRVR